MGTRSFIVIKHENGAITRQYVHWDGYPEGVGRILNAFYQTEAARRELAELGDLSSIGPSAGTPPAHHHFDTPVGGYCVAYGRDRGEKDSESMFFPSFKRATTDLYYWGVEYVYIWNGKEWKCSEVNANGELNRAIPLESVV